MASTFVADLKPKDKNKIIEVKIYLTWIIKYPPNPAPKGFSCILLDKSGNTIQANTNINDLELFKKIFEVDKAYKISNFICDETKPSQRKLPNPTSLNFGKFTKFELIPVDGFPSHYFNFVPYNQLYSRLPPLPTPPMLTDYIGCIQMVGDVIHSADPNKNQVDRLSIDITNLNGNVVQLTLWDALSRNFDKERFSSMTKQVMIAVSSCCVQEYRNQLQLAATQATHYYLNLDIEEVKQALPEYREKFKLNPPLEVVKQKYLDREKEKTRNRFPLSQLVIQHPESYKSVRFTCEGSVVYLKGNENWFHYTCRKCNKKLMTYTPPFECRDDGLQSKPNISYCFRATVTDDSTTTPFVFFSPNAEGIANIECWKLVTEQGLSDPTKLPPALEAIKGKKHVFQFHFNSSCKKGSVEFVFDALLDDTNTQAGRRSVSQEFGSGGTEEMDTKKKKTAMI